MRIRLSNIVTLGVLALLSACMTADQGAPDRPAATAPRPVVFYLDRVGPFVIGSRYTDVAAARKLELQYSTKANGEDEEIATGTGCEMFGAGSGWPGLSLMFEDGVLTRIDLFDPDGPEPEKPLPATTEKGAYIGMKIAQVKQRYGAALKQTPHPYAGDAGWYLHWQPSEDSKYGLIFETEGETVTSFRIGMANSVQYIEGCL